MTATTIRVQMAQRKDTAANWTAANPILLSGEIGYETDTKKFKIGDGTTNWNSLAYLPIPDGSGNLTITGNLEIGNTGSLTFEGSTADGFETTLAVTNPTADRTITLPNQSGTVLVSGNASIVDADISATAEIAVSKLADGTARQLLQTDAAGTGVEWASNIDIPGTLDVTGAATFDAAVSVALGSAASPSLTFTGDNNTGIYSPGADQVAISTGGYGRLFVDASGNIGIGTTSPAANLHVQSSVGSGTLKVGDASNTFIARLQANAGDGSVNLFNEANYALTFGTNNTERARIDSSGNLGIGTSSPQHLLDCASIGRFTGKTNGAASGVGIEIGYDPDTTTGFIQSYNRSSSTYVSTAVDGSDVRFKISGTERARIDSSGRLLVGTSSSFDNTAFVQATSTSGSSTAFAAKITTSNTASVFSCFNSSNSYVGGINVSSTATAFVTSSDYRLKENVVAVTDGIARLQQLKPSRFNFIADPDKTVDGFIAHEVQAVIPEAITGEKDAVDDDGNPQYQGIDQSKLVPLLTAALQEAIGEIESLKARVAALESA